MTKEKLTYLLFLYDYKDKGYTITRIAQEMNTSKSTISRVLNTFYQEGLLLEKGKGKLSCHGCQIAKRYKHDIYELSKWLQDSADFNEEQAYQEALLLVLTLTDEARRKLVNNTRKEKLFKLIKNVKEISGDMLSANLGDGEYPFAFTVYKKNCVGISMANGGFYHPGILEIKLGYGQMVFKLKEVEHVSLTGKMILKGKLESLKYEIENQFISGHFLRGNFILPISKLRFFYSKEERILQTSIKIRVKADVGIIHMPESEAILTIIFK